MNKGDHIAFCLHLPTGSLEGESLRFTGTGEVLRIEHGPHPQVPNDSIGFAVECKKALSLEY
jgi:hypothetical protein